MQQPDDKQHLRMQNNPQTELLNSIHKLRLAVVARQRNRVESVSVVVFLLQADKLKKPTFCL